MNQPQFTHRGVFPSKMMIPHKHKLGLIYMGSTLHQIHRHLAPANLPIGNSMGPVACNESNLASDSACVRRAPLHSEHGPHGWPGEGHRQNRMPKGSKSGGVKGRTKRADPKRGPRMISLSCRGLHRRTWANWSNSHPESA